MSLHRSIHPAKGGGGACFHLRSAWKLLAILFGLLVVATSAAVSATEKTLAEEEPILDHVMANSHEQQMHRQAQFGWISDLLRPDVSDATACTAFEIANDDCIYRNDGECDAGREEFCGIGTDCVDCDPCRARTTTSCDECVNGDNSDNGENNSTACVWCITSTGAGVCSSTTLAEALPLICSPDGGVTNSTFFDTCTDVEAVTPNVTIATDVPAPTPTYTCDGTIDTCQSANDGVCDKSFFTCRGTNSDWYVHELEIKSLLTSLSHLTFFPAWTVTLVRHTAFKVVEHALQPPKVAFGATLTHCARARVLSCLTELVLPNLPSRILILSRPARQ